MILSAEERREQWLPLAVACLIRPAEGAPELTSRPQKGGMAKTDLERV